MIGCFSVVAMKLYSSPPKRLDFGQRHVLFLSLGVFIMGRAQSLSWNSSDGVFGWFDLAALLQLPHLKCLFVCSP